MLFIVYNGHRKRRRHWNARHTFLPNTNLSEYILSVLNIRHMGNSHATSGCFGRGVSDSPPPSLDRSIELEEDCAVQYCPSLTFAETWHKYNLSSYKQSLRKLNLPDTGKFFQAAGYSRELQARLQDLLHHKLRKSYRCKYTTTTDNNCYHPYMINYRCRVHHQMKTFDSQVYDNSV